MMTLRPWRPMRWYHLQCAVLLWLLAACATTEPPSYVRGDLLLAEDFSAGYGWDNRAQDGVIIGTQDGAYQMRVDIREFVRAFNDRTHTNVIIEVEALQRAPDINNAFGLICRGNPAETNASGYYFLIGSDGTYSIRKGVDNDLQPLVAWDQSSLIRTGAATNTLRAICIDDVLALYVNDRLVAQTRDQSYRSGFAGFVAAAADGGVIEVTFDDLRIWAGALPE